jgi:hypothetical protein
LQLRLQVQPDLRRFLAHHPKSAKIRLRLFGYDQSTLAAKEPNQYRSRNSAYSLVLGRFPADRLESFSIGRVRCRKDEAIASTTVLAQPGPELALWAFKRTRRVLWDTTVMNKSWFHFLPG